MRTRKSLGRLAGRRSRAFTLTDDGIDTGRVLLRWNEIDRAEITSWMGRTGVGIWPRDRVAFVKGQGWWGPGLYWFGRILRAPYSGAPSVFVGREFADPDELLSVIEERRAGRSELV